LPISQITQADFDSLELPEECRALWARIQEVEWYVDSSRAVLGVVLFNSANGYWAYMMCARVDDGEFKRLGLGADFTSIEMARKDLIESMERHVVKNDASRPPA
jgi:hypothetical protein